MGAETPDMAALSADPRPFLDHALPSIRRLAVSATASRLSDPEVVARLGHLLVNDPSEEVRCETAQVLSEAGTDIEQVLLSATGDPSALVTEAVAFALGELHSNRAVPWLIETARDHGDALAREAAVASLGAIGHPAGLPVLLELAESGPPQLRRRSVVALSGFEDDSAEKAIRRALEDRNPMVREVAELLVGRPVPTEPLPWPERRT